MEVAMIQHPRCRRPSLGAGPCRAVLAWAGAAFLMLAACEAPRPNGGTDAERQEQAAAYEVWAADQNLNDLYVLDPDGGLIRILGNEELGATQRPHMLWGVPDHPYVYSANTVSESVTVLNGESGEVEAVLEEVGKAPHAAQPNPVHPERIYIFNLAPQEEREDGTPDRGETLAEAVRSGSSAEASWELDRFLDLKASPELVSRPRNNYP